LQYFQGREATVEDLLTYLSFESNDDSHATVEGIPIMASGVLPPIINVSPSEFVFSHIEEADIARQVELLDERDRKRRMGKLPSPPSARHLDDGIQGDIPIEDLMKGLKGFL